MKTAAAVLAAACIAASSISTARAAWNPPLYKQCDPRWGSNEMGTPGDGERSTICGEGCAMSSVSSALAGLGVRLEGELVNPGTMNTWLEQNKGYLCLAGDCNNLRLDAPDSLTSRIKLQGESPKPSLPIMRKEIAKGSTIYIAHVHDNGHFVLVTGWNSAADGFDVNDPFYNTTVYTYDAITDVIAYAVHPAIGSADEDVALTPPLGAQIPFYYPLYKQCDPRWGKDIIVSTTVCAVGCLMSSTSMAIGGKGIKISGDSSNPGTLNSWLKTHGGYTSGNDLIESVVPRVNPEHISWPSDAMHPTNNLPVTTIIELLKSGRPVIANVMHGHHFVLVTGWDGAEEADTAQLRGGQSRYEAVDTLFVNDPGFNRNTYSYSEDVVGWRLFNMTFVKNGTESLW